MTTSADLIARFEGYRDSPYWDVTAYRAGFGSDTTTLPDGSVVPIRQGMAVNRADSLRDLDRRIGAEFRPSVVNAIGEDTWNALAPSQQAVLDSLAYNYGAGAWNKGLRGVTKAVRTPGYEDDIAAIRALASHNDGVNARRRNEEAGLYAEAIGQPAAPTTNALAQAYAPPLPQQMPPMPPAPPEQAQPQQLAWRTAEITPYQMQGNALAAPPRYDTTGYLSRRNG